MLRNKMFKCSVFLHHVLRDKGLLLKVIQQSSKIFLTNVCRIRNVEFERYLSQSFKNKLHEKKSKYVNKFGHLIFGATVLSFAEDKISDEEMQECIQEFCNSVDLCEIKEKKIKSYQKLRHRGNPYNLSRYRHSKSNLSSAFSIDNENNYSQFANKKLSTENVEGFIDSSWNQLIDTKTVKLWRRPLQSNPRIFEYRLCGTFDNISASSFYAVQTDVEYRKEWDDLIVELEILNTDSESDTKIIRWITHYPYPMKDREYIYKRRSFFIQQNSSAIIVSKAISGNKFSRNNNSAVRIFDYKSVMFIQPHRSFEKIGMDYFLIYYDDPKTNFPSPVVSWISTAGIPEFMEKVRKASLALEENSVEKLCYHLEKNYNFNSYVNEDLYEERKNEKSIIASFYSYLTDAFAFIDFNFIKLRD